VFSPLALPEPPAVDVPRLIAWMTWARTEGHARGLNVPERAYETGTGLRYPWLMANVHYGKRGHVEASFDREFPEIVAYARGFPLRDPIFIALLAQREQADVHLHTDSDGPWGFRFYLVNRRADALYFCLARERFDALPPKAADWSQFLDVERRHYARWPAGSRPYCLNSIRAAHAVEAAACELGERIACLVMPRNGVDEEALRRLLDESSARFGDYQIWNRNPILA
jgi:hypothetical protein